MLHNFSLTKQNILNKSEIEQAFMHIKNKVSTKDFIFILSNRNMEIPGICIILHKKTIKKAIKRNFYRRIIKEYFRLNKKLLREKSLIVISKKQASQSTRQELWQSIEKFNKFLTGLQ